MRRVVKDCETLAWDSSEYVKRLWASLGAKPTFIKYLLGSPDMVDNFGDK